MRANCSAKKLRTILKRAAPNRQSTAAVRALMQSMETSHQTQIRALKLFERSLAAAKDWEPGAWEVLGKIK